MEREGVSQPTHHTRKYPPQPRGRTLRLWLPAVHTVFELEQGLADRVREGDAAGVDEGDGADAPALVVSDEERGRKGGGERGEREGGGRVYAYMHISMVYPTRTETSIQNIERKSQLSISSPD